MEPVQNQRYRRMPAKERENPVLQRSLAIDVESQSMLRESISQQKCKYEPKNREQIWTHKREPLPFMFDTSNCCMNSLVTVHGVG